MRLLRQTLAEDSMSWLEFLNVNDGKETLFGGRLCWTFAESKRCIERMVPTFLTTQKKETQGDALLTKQETVFRCEYRPDHVIPVSRIQGV